MINEEQENIKEDSNPNNMEEKDTDAGKDLNPENLDENEEMVGDNDENAIKTIYTCPICPNKYVTLSDIENHIFKYHKISRKIQRQSMHGGPALTILKENFGNQDSNPQDSDEGEEMLGDQDENALQTIYTCPMCPNKYATMPDIENHIFKYHKVTRKIQRQTMHGGAALTIVKISF